MQFQGNLQMGSWLLPILSFLMLIHVVEYLISWFQSTTKSIKNGVQGIMMKREQCGVRCPCASFASLQEQTCKNQVLFGVLYMSLHHLLTNA